MASKKTQEKLTSLMAAFQSLSASEQAEFANMSNRIASNAPDQQEYTNVTRAMQAAGWNPVKRAYVGSKVALKNKMESTKGINSNAIARGLRLFGQGNAANFIDRWFTGAKRKNKVVPTGTSNVSGTSSTSTDNSQLKAINQRLVSIHGLLNVVSQDIVTIRDAIKPKGVMAVNRAGDAKAVLYMPTAPEGSKFGVISESGKLMGIKPSKEHQEDAARKIARETAILMLKDKEEETRKSELRKKYAFREDTENYGEEDPLVRINERLTSIESKLSEKKQPGSLLSLLSAMLGGLVGKLTKMLGGIFDTIKSFISPIFKILGPIAKAIGHVATWAAKFGVWVMKTMWGAIKTITRGLWKLLGRWFPNMPLPAFLGGATAAVATTAAMAYALDKGMKQVGADATDKVVQGGTYKIRQAEKQGMKYDEETKYQIYKKEMDIAWNADYNKNKKDFLRDQWQYSEGLTEEERAMGARYFAEKDGGSTPAPETEAPTGSLSVKPAGPPAGMSQQEWDIYRETLSKIESGGNYAAIGGDNNNFDGRYQMGAAAKADAAQRLGMSIKTIEEWAKPENRAMFRNNPQMQEDMFAAYTQANYGYLKNDPNFKSLSHRKQIEVLGYAHNQGHGGAKNWMRTGVVGSDAFGTKGTAYSEALAANLSSADTQLMADSVTPVPTTSGALVDSATRAKDAATSGIETVVVSAPTLVNNTRVASAAPPRNMPKADTMSSDNSLVRNVLNQTVHPTAI